MKYTQDSDPFLFVGFGYGLEGSIPFNTDITQTVQTHAADICGFSTQAGCVRGWTEGT